jgi:hypothetical protein
MNRYFGSVADFRARHLPGSAKGDWFEMANKNDLAKVVRNELYEMLKPAVVAGMSSPTDVFRWLVDKAVKTEQAVNLVNGQVAMLTGSNLIDERALAAALAPALAPALAGSVLEAIHAAGGQVSGVSQDALADQLVRVLNERNDGTVLSEPADPGEGGDE